MRPGCKIIAEVGKATGLPALAFLTGEIDKRGKIIRAGNIKAERLLAGRSHDPSCRALQ